MKNRIIKILALLLCALLLVGCGMSEDDREREAAKELLGITDEEYDQLKEYYRNMIGSEAGSLDEEDPEAEEDSNWDDDEEDWDEDWDEEDGELPDEAEEPLEEGEPEDEEPDSEEDEEDPDDAESESEDSDDPEVDGDSDEDNFEENDDWEEEDEWEPEEYTEPEEDEGESGDTVENTEKIVTSKRKAITNSKTVSDSSQSATVQNDPEAETEAGTDWASDDNAVPETDEEPDFDDDVYVDEETEEESPEDDVPEDDGSDFDNDTYLDDDIEEEEPNEEVYEDWEPEEPPEEDDYSREEDLPQALSDLPEEIVEPVPEPDELIAGGTAPPEFNWEDVMPIPDLTAEDSNPDGKMAHNIYMDPELTMTAGRFSDFEIDFKADYAPVGTYWSLCNWQMEPAGLDSAATGIEGGGAYAGFQHTEEGMKVILSLWDLSYELNGVKQYISPVGISPSSGWERFGGEGAGGHYILDYDWHPGERYRMRLACYDDSATGSTVIDLYVQNLNTRVETLVARVDTGLSGSCMTGAMSQFMENFDPAHYREVRTIQCMNPKIREVGKSDWHYLQTANLSVDTWYGNKKGSFAFGATDDYFYGITTGVGADLAESAAAVTERFCALFPTDEWFP